MRRSGTPSFILEKKLLASRKDEEALGLRFSYAARIRVQLTKHARAQIQKLWEDGGYRAVLSEREALPGKDKKRRAQLNLLLKEKRLEHGLSLYQFKQWTKPLQCRYRKHLDSRTVQAVADGAWKAAETALFGKDISP